MDQSQKLSFIVPTKAKIVTFFCLVTLISAVSWIYWDRAIAEYFAHHRELRSIARILTRLGNGTPWIFLALFGLGLSYSQQAWRKYTLPFIAMIISILSSGLIINVLKISVGRYRPRAWLHDGIYTIKPFLKTYSKCSFPSGHSQTIFAAMVSLSIIYPKARWFFLGLACSVAMTRLILTNHYLSDVLVGSYIGWVVPILIFGYILPRYQKP
jgi:membrane-associated phospholipid phosphatase